MLGCAVVLFRILEEYLRNAGGDPTTTETILIIFPRMFQECSGRSVGILQKRWDVCRNTHDYLRKTSATRSAVEPVCAFMIACLGLLRYGPKAVLHNCRFLVESTPFRMVEFEFA